MATMWLFVTVMTSCGYPERACSSGAATGVHYSNIVWRDRLTCERALKKMIATAPKQLAGNLQTSACVEMRYVTTDKGKLDLVPVKAGEHVL